MRDNHVILNAVRDLRRSFFVLTLFLLAQSCASPPIVFSNVDIKSIRVCSKLKTEKSCVDESSPNKTISMKRNHSLFVTVTLDSPVDDAVYYMTLEDANGKTLFESPLISGKVKSHTHKFVIEQDLTHKIMTQFYSIVISGYHTYLHGKTRLSFVIAPMQKRSKTSP